MSYEQCLAEAETRRSDGSLKLCSRGYCSAKAKFEAYPSAYANAYASNVCKGLVKDVTGKKKTSDAYVRSLSSENASDNDLHRWFREKWVNVCKLDDSGPGGYADCGTGKGAQHMDQYPYCRPLHKLKHTTVKTVGELSEAERQVMCDMKRSRGGPTRTPARVYVTDLDKYVKVPLDVKRSAQEALRMRELSKAGGTPTGWERAEQLATQRYVDAKTLRDMRVWFSRHGGDARNGGSSYGRPVRGKLPRGYCNYLKTGVFNPGALSWLLWGGSPAYRWLKSDEVMMAIQREYPHSKMPSADMNLSCETQWPSDTKARELKDIRT